MFGFTKENREELADALTADVVDNDLIENLLVAAHMRHMEISSSNSSRGKGMLTAADYDAIKYAYREGELDKYKTSRSDAAVWSSLGFPEEKHSAARYFFAKLRERNGHAVLTNSGHRLGTAYKSLLPAGYQSVLGPFVESRIEDGVWDGKGATMAAYTALRPLMDADPSYTLPDLKPSLTQSHFGIALGHVLASMRKAKGALRTKPLHMAADPGRVPPMSAFSTFREYTSWFTAEQPPGYSHTRIELEKAGSSWRKGCDKRRWSDHRMLWGVVKGRAKQLTAAHNADDVASYADAAAALDLQHKMKPSAYFSKYLKKKGSKAAAESDSSSGQAAAAQAAAAAAAGRRHKRQQVQGEGEATEGEEEEPPPPRGRAGVGSRPARACKRSRR